MREFTSWIEHFLNDIHLSLDVPVYIDETEKTFTVRDYISEIKDKTGIHESCRERLITEYLKSGRVGVLSVLTVTAPLVISQIIPLQVY